MLAAQQQASSLQQQQQYNNEGIDRQNTCNFIIIRRCHVDVWPSFRCSGNEMVTTSPKK